MRWLPATRTVLGLACVLLVWGLPASSAQADEADRTATPAEKLVEAQKWMEARNGPGAIGVLKDIIARREEDFEAAARAQYLMGECLRETYSRPGEAVAEYEKVISDFPGSTEIVDSARVRLAGIHAFAKQWDLVEPQVQAVLADGREGRVRGELVARALLYRGYMHDVIAAEAELAEQPELVLSSRERAMEAYLQAVEWAETGECVNDLTKGLVILLAREHPYLGRELEGKPAQLIRAKMHLAMMLTDRLANAGSSRMIEGLPFKEWRVRSLNRLAGVAEKAGNLDEAIAWHRLAGSVSGDVSDDGQAASEAIVRLLGKAGRTSQVEKWLRYRLDPEMAEDPTAALALAQIGIEPDRAAAGGILNAAARHLAMANFKLSSGKFGEARAEYEAGLKAASTELQLAEALTGLARCSLRLRGLAAAEPLADQAAQHWLVVLEQAESDGQAHYAIEMGGATYSANALPDKAAALLSRMLAIRSVQENPARACFARYVLMLGHINQRRPVEARALGLEILSLYLDRPFSQGHDLIMGYTLLHLGLAEARLGDLESAFTRLDEVARRWPGRFGKEIETYRATFHATTASR